MTQTQPFLLEAPEFEARFGALYRAIFRDWEPCRSSFVHQDWRFVLLGNELDDFPEKEFYALATAAKACGDRELIVTTVETWPIHDVNCVVPWDKMAIQEAVLQSGPWLWALVTALFGESGTWGVICSKGDFTVLGGAPAFMDSFIRNAGGIDRLRSAFLDHFENWCLSEDVKRSHLSDVGWG